MSQIPRFTRSHLPPGATRAMPIAAKSNALRKRSSCSRKTSSIRFRSVTSRPSGMIRTTAPLSSKNGDREKSTQIRVPSAAGCDASNRTSSPPAARRTATRSRSCWPGSCVHHVVSQNGRPMTDSSVVPAAANAVRFASNTTPAGDSNPMNWNWEWKIARNFRSLTCSSCVRSATRLSSVALSSCNWASARICSLMSVFVPNQLRMRCASSRNGLTRVRKGRNRPSAPLMGNTMSNGSPLATDPFQRSSTFGSAFGSWTDCQPHPSISSAVVPVYSCQRRLYQKMWPSGRAIHANCGIVSAN